VRDGEVEACFETPQLAAATASTSAHTTVRYLTAMRRFDWRNSRWEHRQAVTVD
jgi:hypothetical protein